MNPTELFCFHIQQAIKLGGELDKALVKAQIDELNRAFFPEDYELPQLPDVVAEMFDSWMKRDGIE